MTEITKRRDINLRIRFNSNELADLWRKNPGHQHFSPLRDVLSEFGFTLIDMMEQIHQLAKDVDDLEAYDDSENENPELRKKIESKHVLSNPQIKDYYDRVFIAGMEKGGQIYDRLTVDDRVKKFIIALRRPELLKLVYVSGIPYPETKYQVRLVLTDEFNKVVAEEGADSTAKLLHVMDFLGEDEQKLLTGLKLSASSQLDNFEAYVKQAKNSGVDDGGLSDWTERVINNPQKRAYYSKTLILHVDGEEMNDAKTAEKLRDAFKKLEENGLVVKKIKVASDNPANNPQPPKHVM